MKRNIIIMLAMAVFFAINFFSAEVLAGDPPSSKIKLPAKFENKQEVFLDGGAGGKQVRDVVVIVKPDSSGEIEVGKFYFSGGYGHAGEKIEVQKFEVEGEYLVVVESSPPVNKLKKFRIDGENLFLEGWDFGKKWVYNYQPTILKRDM